MDWPPEPHLVFFQLDLAAKLGPGEIHGYYRRKDTCDQKACWEDAAFRVLTGNQLPDQSRIGDRRRRHLDASAGVFVQF